MNKATKATAEKMLQIVKVKDFQGKMTYLIFAFLYHTRAGFSEIAPLKVGDVYRLGHAKKSLTLGTGGRERTLLLNQGARTLIEATLEVQFQQGFQPTAEAPLFRLTSGMAFTADQLARLFWFYREAAEL